jgi:two-component system chemotaxis response regulator CheY
MKVLIVEDDFISRQVLRDIMKQYGDCDVVMDGEEAVQAFRLAWEDKAPYDLIMMDIMMPRKDGKQAVKEIRSIERENNILGSKEVKIVMTTALGDPKTVFESYYQCGATSYLVKPLTTDQVLEELHRLKLFSENKEYPKNKHLIS